MVLISTDVQDENFNLNVGADIHQYESFDAFMLEYNSNDGNDDMVVDCEVGSFGDCWVKVYERPELNDDGYTVVDGIECSVQNPGTHPGGNCYWLTPVEDVLVPEFGPNAKVDEFV